MGPRTGCVVDRVAAAARRPPFQAAQLCGEPWKVEELDATAIQRRENRSINVRLGFVGEVVCDPVGAEPLARPLACISVARDAGDPILLQQPRELDDHALRTERW